MAKKQITTHDEPDQEVPVGPSNEVILWVSECRYVLRKVLRSPEMIRAAAVAAYRVKNKTGSLPFHVEEKIVAEIACAEVITAVAETWAGRDDGVFAKANRLPDTGPTRLENACCRRLSRLRYLATLGYVQPGPGSRGPIDHDGKMRAAEARA